MEFGLTAVEVAKAQKLLHKLGQSSVGRELSEARRCGDQAVDRDTGPFNRGDANQGAPNVRLILVELIHFDSSWPLIGLE